MIFRFKQFEIKHADSLLKVNTDAVLLGALIPCNETINTILDIGTGCGIIAMMLAQRFTSSRIDAIEIDEPSFLEAGYNFQHGPFHDRMHAFHGAIQDFQPDKKYDLICCNPPYFETPDFSKGNNTLDIGDKRRKFATHFTLNFETLLTHVQRILSTDGDFWVIIPFQSKEKFISIAHQFDLFLNEEIAIRSKPQSAFIRCILCFSFKKNENPKTAEFVIYNDDGSRHDQYSKVTESYYL